MKCIVEEHNFDVVQLIYLKDKLVDLEFRFSDVVGGKYFCKFLVQC